MAEIKVEIPASDAWTEVISSAPSNELTVQNIGEQSVVLRFTDTAPDDAETWGFILAPGEGDRRLANLTKVYARPLNFSDGDVYAFTA